MYNLQNDTQTTYKQTHTHTQRPRLLNMERGLASFNFEDINDDNVLFLISKNENARANFIIYFDCKCDLNCSVFLCQFF